MSLKNINMEGLQNVSGAEHLISGRPGPDLSKKIESVHETPDIRGFSGELDVNPGKNQH